MVKSAQVFDQKIRGFNKIYSLVVRDSPMQNTLVPNVNKPDYQSSSERFGYPLPFYHQNLWSFPHLSFCMRNTPFSGLNIHNNQQMDVPILVKAQQIYPFRNQSFSNSSFQPTHFQKPNVDAAQAAFNHTTPPQETQILNLPIKAEENESKLLNQSQYEPQFPGKPLNRNSVREQKVKLYLQKKKRRINYKKILYMCRKKVADSRVRFKGRFMSKKVIRQHLNLPQEFEITNQSIKQLSLKLKSQ